MATCSKCKGTMREDSVFKNCDGCRKTAKAKEDGIKKAREEKAAREVTESSGSKKMCSRCKYARDIKAFKTGDKEFNCCLSCRENGQRNDRKRKDSDSRTEWMKTAPDYWKVHRAKKRTCDLEEFLKHNAEVMKAWRDRNPDRVVASREKTKRADNIRGIKQQAEVKGLAWEISHEWATELSAMPCFYCGGFSPSEINGIDRLDSLNAYTKSNVRPCCKACNMSKGTLDPKSFVDACAAIHEYLTGAKGESASGSGLAEHSGCGYNRYKSRAARMGIEFELSEAQFLDVRALACYLCGRNGRLNGIDRKDNTIGYTIANSFPCCGECNYLKRDHRYEEFVEMVAKIASNAFVVRGLLPEDIGECRNSRSRMRFDKLKGDALKEHCKKKRDERLAITQDRYKNLV